VRQAVDHGALNLPGGKTPGVEMVGLQTGRDAGLIEHDLKFRMLSPNRFAADGAMLTAAVRVEHEVLLTCSQMPMPDRCAGLLSEQKFVRHRRQYDVLGDDSQVIEIASSFRKLPFSNLPTLATCLPRRR
jgi:hypothetical protein